MEQAGWDLSKPLELTEALQALTGFEADNWYIPSMASSMDKDSFAEQVFKPIRGTIAVLNTKKDPKDERLKGNYAYHIQPVPVYADNPENGLCSR